MEFKRKYQEIFKLFLADNERERERERKGESFQRGKEVIEFCKGIHGATMHLLLELRLIGPGQRLALLA
jgi:hypothetical protein